MPQFIQAKTEKSAHMLLVSNKTTFWDSQDSRIRKIPQVLKLLIRTEQGKCFLWRVASHIRAIMLEIDLGAKVL